MQVAQYGPGTGLCLSIDECACQREIPCLLSPSRPTGLLGSFCGSSASHGLILPRAFMVFCLYLCPDFHPYSDLQQAALQVQVRE